MTVDGRVGTAGSRGLSLFAPGSIPEIHRGANLAEVILRAIRSEGFGLSGGDILVLAQKIVSKAEGRMVRLADVQPSQRALELAQTCRKDPRLVELILAESREVLRCVPGLIVVRHKLGYVLANAGIDQSNVAGEAGEEVALLLPEQPDRSARIICEQIRETTGVNVGVAVIDSWGRAWRLGTCGTCIGAHGVKTVADLRGSTDLFGRPLATTIVGVGDELAAAASLLMGQASEGLPLVVVRGTRLANDGGSASALLRPESEDLFR